ncbi:MAG: hypothetical protein AMXMBFR7_26820 [Planctomycetota bacterium]
MNASAIHAGIEAEIQLHEARGTKARLACESILEAALGVGREKLSAEEQREYDLYSRELESAQAAIDALADRLEALNAAGSAFIRACEVRA